MLTHGGSGAALESAERRSAAFFEMAEAGLHDLLDAVEFFVLGLEPCFNETGLSSRRRSMSVRSSDSLVFKSENRLLLIRIPTRTKRLGVPTLRANFTSSLDIRW